VDFIDYCLLVCVAATDVARMQSSWFVLFCFSC